MFIVYSSAYHHEPLMGVWVSEMDDGSYEYTCYTNSKVYSISGQMEGYGTQNLKPGLYIKDGKKIIVR